MYEFAGERLTDARTRQCIKTSLWECLTCDGDFDAMRHRPFNVGSDASVYAGRFDCRLGDVRIPVQDGQ